MLNQCLTVNSVRHCRQVPLRRHCLRIGDMNRRSHILASPGGLPSPQGRGPCWSRCSPMIDRGGTFPPRKKRPPCSNPLCGKVSAAVEWWRIGDVNRRSLISLHRGDCRPPKVAGPVGPAVPPMKDRGGTFPPRRYKDPPVQIPYAVK